MGNTVDIVVKDREGEAFAFSFGSTSEVDNLIAKLIMVREKVVELEQQRFEELKQKLRKQQKDTFGSSPMSDVHSKIMDDVRNFVKNGLEETEEEFRDNYGQLESIYKKMPEGNRKEAIGAVLEILSAVNDVIDKHRK